MSRSYTTIEDEEIKKAKALADADVEASNNIYNTSAQVIRDTYGATQKQKEQEYNALFDQNNVQKYINERRIAENMANAGLTNSGLNRTQMTANQLSFANQQHKISLQKQQTIYDIARVMNAELTQNEAQRAAAEQNIRSGYTQRAKENAAKIYNSELEYDASVVKAQQDAIASAQKQMQSDRDTLMKALAGNTNEAYKAQLVQNFKTKYGLSDDDVFKMVGDWRSYKTTGNNDADVGSDISDDEMYDLVTNAMELFHPYLETHGLNPTNETEQKNLDAALSNSIFKIAESNGWIYYVYDEKGRVPMLNEQGLEFQRQVLDRTEGTRKFWTNPHVDGSAKYVEFKEAGKKTKKYKYNIPYSSVITDSYGNKWTLSQVYEASYKALKKEGKLKGDALKKQAEYQTYLVYNKYK